MIKNDRQYNAAKKQIEKLNEALELSRNHPVEMNPDIYDAMLAGIASQIHDIQKEVEEYEKLKEEKELPIDNLANIGRLLIQARIACGYTQKELAERVGIKPQQIQQYEQNEYSSAKLGRMLQIMCALDFDAFVELAKKNNMFIQDDLRMFWNVDSVHEVDEVPVSEVDSPPSLTDVLSSSDWDFGKAA